MPNIKILICYHKPSPTIIANEVLQPMLLGACNADKASREALENACRAQGVELWCDDGSQRGGAILPRAKCQHSSPL